MLNVPAVSFGMTWMPPTLEEALIVSDDSNAWSASVPYAFQYSQKDTVICVTLEKLICAVVCA